MMLVPTTVAPSPIHGNGLFATQPIPKGTPIWRFEPTFDHCFSPDAWSALPEPAKSHTRWFCFVRSHDLHLVLSGDHACFLNHSPNPNTGAPPSASPPITTIALRDIAPGEELTCNYWAYDADTPWKLGLVSPLAPLGSGDHSLQPTSSSAPPGPPQSP